MDADLGVPSHPLRGGGAIIDGTSVVGARAAVDLLKAVRGAVTPEQRQIVLTGAIEWTGESDYDDLEAFGAFIVRVNVAKCIAIGPEARAIFASVGREGSWDGESQHVEDVASAYDEVSNDIGPGDVVVVLGGVPKDMGALVLRLSELLA